MTIIIDASSLILLTKAGVLELLANRNDIVTSKIVYEEVVRGKEKGREDAMAVEKLVQEDKLIVKMPTNLTKRKIGGLFNMRKGELEVISLAYKTNHTILSDDKKCLNAAKALGINFITSLDVIVTLYRKGTINKERALQCISALEEYGWYAKDLIKGYEEAIK